MVIGKDKLQCFSLEKAGILTKFITVTTLQYINQFVFNRSVDNLKINIG